MGKCYSSCFFKFWNPPTRKKEQITRKCNFFGIGMWDEEGGASLTFCFDSTFFNCREKGGERVKKVHGFETLLSPLLLLPCSTEFHCDSSLHTHGLLGRGSPRPISTHPERYPVSTLPVSRGHLAELWEDLYFDWMVVVVPAALSARARERREHWEWRRRI